MTAPDPIRAQAVAFVRRMLATEAEKLAATNRKRMDGHKLGDEHHTFLAAYVEEAEFLAKRLHNTAGEGA